MNLEELRNDIIIRQKKGLPFIITSVIIWTLITVVSALNMDIFTKNILVFCCSCPLVPIAWIIGKKMDVDIFDKENPLGELGFLFTMNQMIYLLIVIWIFNAMPEKMVMVYAMVFGAHLFPYAWLYKSKAYITFAVCIPFITLILGNLFSAFVVAGVVAVLEIGFVLLLFGELNRFNSICNKGSECK